MCDAIETTVRSEHQLNERARVIGRCLCFPFSLAQHSTDLKVTERFRRVDEGHLLIDFKMEDPKFLVKPWTSTFHYELRPKWELGEISCSGDYLSFSKFEK